MNTEVQRSRSIRSNTSSVESLQEAIRQNSPDTPRHPFIFSHNDLTVRFEKLFLNTVLAFNRKPVELPPGLYAAVTDFTPQGHTAYQLGTRSATIHALITGYTAFFDYMERQENPVPLPHVFYSVTNRQMAEFKKRFGFHIAEVEHGTYVTLAATSEVKQRINALRQRQINGTPFMDYLAKRIEYTSAI